SAAPPLDGLRRARRALSIGVNADGNAKWVWAAERKHRSAKKAPVGLTATGTTMRWRPAGPLSLTPRHFVISSNPFPDKPTGMKDALGGGAARIAQVGGNRQ